MTIAENFQHLQTLLENGQFVPEPEEDIAQLRQELQLEMLQETLDYAAKSVPYYANRWRNLDVSPGQIQSLQELQQLPLLYKADVVANRHQMYSDAVRIISYRCTSGTTGIRMPLPISYNEIDAINKFGQLRALASGLSASESITLRVVPPVRRIASDTGGGGQGPVITTFLNLDAADLRFDYDYYDHIIQCLMDDFPVSKGSGRVEVLWTSPPFMIRTITEGLLQRSFAPSTSMVRHIVSSGGIVTKALCNYVKGNWDAQLHSFYSLTEVAGSHQRCAISGAYHFDLFAIPEFIDPISMKAVRDGREGVLVLTSLLPFQQAQPMIRYWTDDIFTLQEGSCECGFSGLSGIFRGRRHECLNLSEVLPPSLSPRYLGAADVLEVLQQYQELPHFHKNPKFNLSLEQSQKGVACQVLLRVESYVLSTAAEAALANKIRDGLAHIFSPSGILEPDFFGVKLVRKGELRHSTGFYPDR